MDQALVHWLTTADVPHNAVQNQFEVAEGFGRVWAFEPKPLSFFKIRSENLQSNCPIYFRIYELSLIHI